METRGTRTFVYKKSATDEIQDRSFYQLDYQLTPPDCPCNNFRGCEIEISNMGLKKLILLAIVGPMIAYSLLMAHVIYQV